MQNDNYLYIVDNTIEFYQKKSKQFFEYNLSKKIVEQGKIVHQPKFLREFQNFLKKNHIIKKLQKNNLYIIIPPKFNEIDKETWKQIFENTSFQKMKFVKETNCYSLKKNVLWINLNQDYAYLTYLSKHHKESLVLQNNYLGYNLAEQLLRFLEQNKSIKKIFLFGSNKEINQISEKIEKITKKMVLYFERAKYYIINETTRHNLP